MSESVSYYAVWIGKNGITYNKTFSGKRLTEQSVTSKIVKGWDIRQIVKIEKV